MITICIPTYNQSAFLRRAVDSVLAQRGVDVEVWVADDCSTDDTAAVMRTYAGDARVHYHRHERNLGISGNAGWVLAQARSEYVVRLDSDDLLAPGYCAALAAALDQYPQAGVAHAGVQEIDEHGRPRRLRLLRRPAGFQSGDEALRMGVSGYRVAANICMFRRSALPVGGVYRAGLNFCEDWDLYLRLADNGWGNVYLAEVLASYRVWLDGKGVRAGRRRIEIQGGRRVFEETLTPAWQRHAWPMEALREARSQLARAQARSLANPAYQPDEKIAIIADLRALSPSDPVLERKIRLMQTVWARLLLALDRGVLALKDRVKALALRGRPVARL